MDLALRRDALAFLLFPGLLPLCVTACSDGYSPNTYAATAAQQQATVERGVIIGARQVLITPDGTIGAATGGAAGGLAGAQVPGSTLVTAFGAIGGTLVGGLSGAAAQKAIGDTKAWEYIVQETGDKLVSITQTSKTALPIGQHVLVIAGTQQARIVPDYTVQLAVAPPAVSNPPKTAAASNAAANAEVNLIPILPGADTAAPFQLIPANVTNDPARSPQPSPASTDSAAALSSTSLSSTSGQAATEPAGSGGSAAVTPSARPAPAPVQVARGTSNANDPQSSNAAVTRQENPSGE